MFPIWHFRWQLNLPVSSLFMETLSSSFHILWQCCASWRSWVCGLPRWHPCTSCWQSDSWHLWHIWAGLWNHPAETPSPSETSQTPPFPWSPWTHTTKKIHSVKIEFSSTDTHVTQTKIISQNNRTKTQFLSIWTTAHKSYHGIFSLCITIWLYYTNWC